MVAFSSIADDQEVLHMVQRGVSHSAIAFHYQSQYPNERGLSERSVRRYCHERGIARLNHNEVKNIVYDLIRMYGHSYGRRLMQGSVRSLLGITGGAVSQRRIARALREVAPHQYQARALDILERTNPVPYIAPLILDIKDILTKTKKLPKIMDVRMCCLLTDVLDWWQVLQVCQLKIQF